MEKQGYIEMITKQAAMDLIAAGITKPSAAQLDAALRARFQRNHEICVRMTDNGWVGTDVRQTVRDALCGQVYNDIRGQS